MNSPYFNTYLHATVTLHPSQMNNDIYKHLKNNLIKDLQGKCYKHYGHITKIYKIEERKGGNIIAEDASASATYHVKFSCKLCKPLKNSIIVCEIEKINKDLIKLVNGPIDVLIFVGHDQINSKNFIYDEKRNVLLANIGNGKGIPVTVGTHVKIKVLGSLIQDNSRNIVVLGTIENIATKKESDESILVSGKDNIDFVDYEDYVKQEFQTKKNEEEIVMSENESAETEESDEQ